MRRRPLSRCRNAAISCFQLRNSGSVKYSGIVVSLEISGIVVSLEIPGIVVSLEISGTVGLVLVPVSGTVVSLEISGIVVSLEIPVFPILLVKNLGKIVKIVFSDSRDQNQITKFL